MTALLQHGVGGVALRLLAVRSSSGIAIVLPGGMLDDFELPVVVNALPHIAS